MPILVVQHEDKCPPALFESWLHAAGALLDVCRPYRGEALPPDLSGHAGLLVLGGSMGADDDALHPWLTATKALVRFAARDGTVTLGVCLGHQLIASALGGTVTRNPSGQQVGLLPLGRVAGTEHDPLLPPYSGRMPRALHWNHDVVTRLPPGAEVLARAPGGEVQAVRFGPAMWGVQFHPEVDEETVRPWAEQDRDRLIGSGVDVDDHLAAVRGAREELAAAWEPCAARFAGMAQRATVAS